jgi:hypothetical protein
MTLFLWSWGSDLGYHASVWCVLISYSWLSALFGFVLGGLLWAVCVDMEFLWVIGFSCRFSRSSSLRYGGTRLVLFYASCGRVCSAVHHHAVSVLTYNEVSKTTRGSETPTTPTHGEVTGVGSAGSGCFWLAAPLAHWPAPCCETSCQMLGCTAGSGCNIPEAGLRL